MAESRNPDLVLHVVGTGNPAAVAAYRALAQREGVSAQVIFHGAVPHGDISTMMQAADLLFFTSIMEATSTVVLEAIEAELPVLSFNTCGFGPLVKAFAGETIEVTTPATAAKAFAKTINYLHQHPEQLSEISLGERHNRSGMTYQGKARATVEIYHRIARRTERAN